MPVEVLAAALRTNAWQAYPLVDHVADKLCAILERYGGRRDLTLPVAFDVPGRAVWERGYRAEARRTVGFDAVELGAALAIPRPACSTTRPQVPGTRTIKPGHDDAGRRSVRQHTERGNPHIKEIRPFNDIGAGRRRALARPAVVVTRADEQPARARGVPTAAAAVPANTGGISESTAFTSSTRLLRVGVDS